MHAAAFAAPRPPPAGPVLAGAGAALAVTATFLIPLLGPPAAAVLLAAFIPYAAAYPRAALTALTRRPAALIWAFPALAIASALWSADPGASLRYGVQAALTVSIAVLIARRIPPTRILLITTAAVFVIAVLCLAIGRSGLDALTSTVAFVGIFESKNQFGFLIAMLMLCAGATALCTTFPRPIRLAALLTLPLAIPLLIRSQSAGAFVSAFLALSVLIAAFVTSRLRPAERALLALAAACVALPALLLLALSDDLAALVVERLLHRDATLTGRTELWEFARAVIARNPWTGMGYAAFWQPGNPDAEFLWRKFFVSGGFHFHNQWLDFQVQLGLPGLVLLGTLHAAALLGTLRWSWRERGMLQAFFVATAALLFARSMFEVDLPTQFQPGTILFYVTLTLALDAWVKAPTPPGAAAPAETAPRSPRGPAPAPGSAPPRRPNPPPAG